MSLLTDTQQEFYRAYSQSYRTEANKRVIVFVVDVVFAAAAAAVTIMTIGDYWKSALDILASWSPPAVLLWLIVRETDLIGDDREHRRIAVTIQEQFDLTFWKSDNWHEGWNQLLCGDPTEPRTIKDLALSYEGEPLADDYWVDTTGLLANNAALLRIRQSAGWGAKGHARYERLNRSAAWVGFLIVLAVALLFDLSTRDAAVVLMTVAPLLVGRLQSARAHASLAQRRETLERHIQKLLSSSTPATKRDVRITQGELCRMRLENRRIPVWLYTRYAARDRKTVDTAAAQDTKRLQQSRQQAHDKSLAP